MSSPPATRFPRLYAAASLKHGILALKISAYSRFSAALCRGLIEAPATGDCGRMPRGFPRLYAAASLKPAHHRHAGAQWHRFSAALCRGLIEAETSSIHENWSWAFSAALCRGLIEAREHLCARVRRPLCFPRLYAAASLKRIAHRMNGVGGVPVFRGFMPRPH